LQTFAVPACARILPASARTKDTMRLSLTVVAWWSAVAEQGTIDMPLQNLPQIVVSRRAATPV
jgi:hypothetical protein